MLSVHKFSEVQMFQIDLLNSPGIQSNISKKSVEQGADKKKSNTEKFWRKYDNNYYAREVFDFFTYEGRRMGAHSGSSADDLIFLGGIGNKNNFILFSWNKERQGIKSTSYPEHKSELQLTYNRKLNNNHTVFIKLENENIKNYGFIQNSTSSSKLIWIGYSFLFN